MANIIRRFSLFMLGAVFGAAAIPAGAQAAFEKTIVDGDGVEIGSISFPAASGPPTAGLEFAIEGFTQADLKSITWQLDGTGAVMTLELEAFQGDDPCPPTPMANCVSDTLLLNQDSYATAHHECSGFGGGGIGQCVNQNPFFIPVSFVDSTPAYVCKGFKGPLAKGPVAIKRKRLAWLRATLRDADGKRLRRRDLDAAPLLEVTFEPAAEAAARLALPGIGADGTAFVPIGNQWHLLLTLKDLADPGSYTVKMVSGDPSAYRIDPTCEGVFVR